MIDRQHVLIDGKIFCPITKKYVDSSFTDHDIEGSFNSCKYCNPDKFKPLKQRLRELNTERKKVSE